MNCPGGEMQRRVSRPPPLPAPSLSVGALTRSTVKWKRQLEEEENTVKQLARVWRDRQIVDLRIRQALVGF